MEALTEGMDTGIRSNVLAVANRQREMLLTEGANVPGSASAFGWTVLSFPILADIYAEPVISKLCNVYPVSSPVASIPRIKIMAYIKGYDGAVTQVKMPTAQQQIRPNALTLTVEPNTANDIFTLASTAVSPATVSADLYRINRRYTLITKVVTTPTVSGTPGTNIATSVVIKPDNRNQFVGTFSFLDGTTPVVANLTGHIDYDSGAFTYQVLYTGGVSGTTYAADNAELTIRFTPTNTMNGRIRVKINTEMTDVKSIRSVTCQ